MTLGGGSDGGAQTASPTPRANAAVRSGVPEPAAADLAADERLEQRATARIKSRPVAEVLRVLSPTKPGLQVSPEVADRRITCLGNDVRLRDWMEAIADVLSLTWRAVPGTGRSPAAGYELFQTRAQTALERGQKAGSEARAQWAFNTQKRALVSALQDAARHPERSGVTGNLLATLSPAQLSATGDIAPMPGGIMAADSLQHTHDRLVGLTLFSSLPRPVRSGIDQKIGQLPDYMARPPGAGSEQGLARSFVGLCVSNAGVCVVVVDPQGRDAWLLPGSGDIRRPGLPGIDNDIGVDPEARESVERQPVQALVALDGVDRRSRISMVTFDGVKHRHRLPALLERLHVQTGLPFVADDFLRSRNTTFRWLLTDRDSYALKAGLLQIARAFGHRFQGRSNVIRVRTVTPGLDLRGEIPSPLLARTAEIEKRKLTPTWQDHLDFGALTDFQWQTLFEAGDDVAPVGPRLSGVFRERRWIRPYLELAEAEQQRAETPSGLLIPRLHPRKRATFWPLLNVGILARRSAPGDAVPEALFVTRAPAAPAPGTAAKQVLVRLRLTARPGTEIVHSIRVGEPAPAVPGP
jgi:hypothetical protein